MEKSECEPEIISLMFPDKTTVLAAYMRQVDTELEKSFSADCFSLDETIKDRLFDVFMERFDLLNENRKAVLSILNHVTLQPSEMISTLPQVYQSVELMLSLVEGERSCGVKGCIRTSALVAVYIKTLKDWAKDLTEDMSITMASLDNNLSYFEKIR